LITRSIWKTGLKTTDFFSRPFELAFEKLPDEVIEAYGLQVEQLMKTALKNG
jgi:hypothetical protein